MSKHLLRLALRGATRHRGRTLLTAGMVGIGVALLIIALSLINGIFGGMLKESAAIAGHVRIVTEEFAARERLIPLHENIDPVEPLLEALREHPSVEQAFPRIVTGVTVTVGEEIGDVFAMVVGAPHEYYADHLGITEDLAQGRWFQQEGELVLGPRVARRLGAEIGDEVILLGMTQDGSLSPVRGTLTGILHGGNSFLDHQVFLGLEQVQWIVDIPQGALEILVFGSRYQNAPTLARQLQDMPALSGMNVLAWNQREPWAGLGQVVEMIRGIIILFVIVLAALGVLNTMMMSVLERTGEIGVLRAMGLSRLGTMGVFLAEAMAIAFLGGIAGVLLGIGPAYLLEKTGLHFGEDFGGTLSSDIPVAATVHPELTMEIVILSFLLGLFTAVLGSLIPSLKVATIPPYVAMRTKR